MVYSPEPNMVMKANKTNKVNLYLRPKS